MATERTQVENGHGFISTANLDRLEVGLVIFARRLICAQNAGLVHILPCVFATEDIVDLFALQVEFVLKLLLDSEHVGTRLAKEPEVAGRLLCKQDIGAARTKQHY